MARNTTSMATASVLVSGALWGSISLFVRGLSAAGLGVFEMLAGRMAVAVLCLLVPILATRPSRLRVRPRDLAFIGCMGLTIVAFNFFYIRCIMLSEASVAVVLLYTSPLFIVVLGAAIYHEPLGALKLVALGLTLVGCTLVSGFIGSAQAMTPLAFASGIAGGFFYALYSIFGRTVVGRCDGLATTFYTFLFALAASLLLCDKELLASVVTTDPTTLLWFAGLGLFCSVLSYLAYNWGLARMEAGRAGILASSEVLVGAALGIFAYGEPAGAGKIVGMVLILASVVLVNHGTKES